MVWQYQNQYRQSVETKILQLRQSEGWRDGSALAALPGDAGLIPGTHTVTRSPRGSVPSSGLCGHWVYTLCRYIHGGKILIHVELNLNFKS